MFNKYDLRPNMIGNHTFNLQFYVVFDLSSEELFGTNTICAQ